jgi:iron complex transport system permease protein
VSAALEDSVLPGQVLRTEDDRISLRWRPRTLLTCAALTIAVLVLVCLGLTTGDFPVPIGRVLAALSGHGTGIDDFIVVKLRLPRLVTGILIGAALGISGAVFQSLSRNPLGSPDIIGFTSGAAAGAVLQIITFHGSSGAVALSAIGGGLATAAVVYLLAVRNRKVSGYRLVLVGIGVGATLDSVTTYLLTRGSLREAQSAQVWLLGSLNGTDWHTVVPLGLALLLLVPATLSLGRALTWLEMGDDVAKALGVPVERTRLCLVIGATALAAAATAAAGPIAFVALAAPQLCRPLTRSSGPQLVPAAFMGAALLTASDFAAQRIVPSVQLPVGVMTGVIGGAYLCWLLAHEWKTGRA